MVEHEVLVLGAGHNGLSAAAYLAKAGLDVGVVEGRSFYGGGAQTQAVLEGYPDFKCETDSVFHGFIQGNPLIANDELGLISKYGLNYYYPEVTFSNVWADGTYFSQYYDIDKTCESIAKVDEEDAERYKDFYDYAGTILPMLTTSLFAPAPPFGQLMAMLDSSEGGRELMRALMASSWTIVNEYFKNEYIKVGLLKLTTEAMMAPEQDGTGAYLFMMLPSTHLHPHGLPIGGGLELPRSMVDCIEDHQGKVYLDCDITHIDVVDGRCVGCTCANGEVFRATKAVLSTLNVKQLFGGENPLLDEGTYPERIGYKVQRTSLSSASTITCNYALDIECPDYKVGGDVNRTLSPEMLPMMDEFRQHWYDVQEGKVPKDKIPYAACHDIFDSTKSPEGKCSVQLYDPVPFHLSDGGAERWDEIKERVEDDILDWWKLFTTNINSDTILARRIMSPLDLPRWNKNYIDGENSGLGAQLYQYMSYRPIPELGGYRTPIEGLYTGGMTSHPGSGVCGGGRVPVQVMFEDLGIDFNKVITS